MSENTTNAVSVATEAAPPTLRQQVTQMEHQFALAAPKGVEARQIVRDVLTAISQNPDLLRCDPQSVLGGAMTMAQLGLRVGVLGHGWLLPFREWKSKQYKAQLVIGYQGLIALAHRSGQIKSLSARVVHENDHFDVEYGVNENLTHRPASGDRGAVIGYYAVVKFLPDGHSFYYLTKGEAEIYRDRYAMAKNRNGEVVGPWKTEFDAMAMKTCIRQLSKFMPKGTDLATALAADETVRLDVQPTSSPEHVSTHPEQPTAAETVHVGHVVDEATGEVTGGDSAPWDETPAGGDQA